MNMDEEVVFTSSDFDLSVQEAVDRWEKEFASILNVVTPHGDAKTLLSISLDTTSSLAEADNSFDAEMGALADSERILSAELDRFSPQSAPLFEGVKNTDEFKDEFNIRNEASSPLRKVDYLFEFKERLSQHQNENFKRGSSAGHSRPDPPSTKQRCRMFDPEGEPLMPSEESHSNSLQEGHAPLPHGTTSPSHKVQLCKSAAHDKDFKILNKRFKRQSTEFRKCARVTWALSCIFLLVLSLAAVVTFRIEHDDDKRINDIFEFLVTNEISTPSTLRDPSSPQFQAASWIATQDKLRLPITGSRNGGRFVDRYVLSLLYFAMGGPATWPHDLNFLSPKHVCSWMREPTNESDTDMLLLGVHGCQRDMNGYLVPGGITLAFHGLHGQIPDEIRHLNSLEVLILQYNPALGGTLPFVLHAMAQMRHLSLEHCSIGGTLPTWLGDMTKLTRLGLGDNRLTGTIPTTLSKLTKLHDLGLGDNQLTASTLDMLLPMTDLQTLYLNNNYIDATLADDFLTTFSHLTELDLSENEISGSIPLGLFSHTSLKIVDLHANRLTGWIPQITIEANVRLQYLALNENELQGSIPSSLARLVSLRHLDVSHNLLTGTVPETITSMINLRSLFVGDNDLTEGSVPKHIIQLASLEELSLSNMNMVGSIPHVIGFLSNLRYLDLSRNTLTGTLPDTVGFLSELDILLLNDNNFSGQLPEELNLLAKLDVLYLEGNNFTGSADAICVQSSPVNISVFVGDCNESSSSFSCSCCTLCCAKGGDSCSDGHRSRGHLDGFWGQEYKRNKYDFGQGTIFLPGE